MRKLARSNPERDMQRDMLRNIAFAVDDQDGETAVVFVGAEADLLIQLFTFLCKSGAAEDFSIREELPPMYRHGYVYDRQTVTLEGFDRHMMSSDVLALMVERWFGQNTHCRHIDRYGIDDLLNLSRRDPKAVINKKKEQRKQKDTEEMANIYLKVPWYVAAHFRGRDEENQLTEWEPVKFSDYDHEYQIMVNNLRNIPEQNQSPICYSQRAWQNILRGKTPDGKAMISRDQTKWPDVRETATLTGCNPSARHNSSDYLCIEMPREVYHCKRLFRSNAGYTLPTDSAYFLAKMLTDRFCYEYTQWYIADQRIALSQGFKRKQQESVERYYTQFNFPVAIDPKLRESMRRQHNRFFKRGHSKPSFGLQFSHSFLEHLSDVDKKKIESNKKKGTII